jgi:hypothetical protein
MGMDKLDLTKKYKSYYTAKTKPELVEVEKAQFLSITGKGDPSDQLFAEKIQALYATAYTIKFMLKEKGKDFTVARLEGLWWFDDQQYGGLTMSEAPKKVPRSEWEYRLLLRMPDFVTRQLAETVAQAVITKKGIALAAEIEWYEMTEGKAVQMLHVGPFDKEPETLEKMISFIREGNFQKNGFHHEIYLSDFRKTPPEKLKTILREPVK